MIPKIAGLRRRLWAALLGVAVFMGLLGGSPTPARAEGEGPALEVVAAGWDGNVTAGTWAPVRVRLTGGAADAEAVVEVLIGDKYEAEPGKMVRVANAAYGQEVSLPARNTKEVTLWVPTSRGLSGTVQLVVGDQVVASGEIDLRPTKAEYWPLIGLLSDQETLAGDLGKIEMPLQNLPAPVHVARLTAGLIPDRAERLRGLRAIVVQGNAPSGLSEAQRQAIRSWVEGGGHLLLAGGPDSALTAAVLPAGTLPVAFGGAEVAADLGPLYAWVGAEPAAGGATGPIAKLQHTGGDVLAGSPDRPLAWRTTLGLGSITLLAVDPTLEPLASWSGRTALLKRALSAALYDEFWTEEQRMQAVYSRSQNRHYQLRGVVDSLPSHAYPTWQQVALYLGGFALLAGPVIHLLLGRNRRRGWVWVAVPALSALVAGSASVYAMTIDGRDVLLHTLSHVKIDPDSHTATQAAVVGLYAPMYPRLTVAMDGEAAADAMILMEGRNWGPWSAPANAGVPPYRLINGRETMLELVGGAGGMRPIAYSRSLGDAAGYVDARLGLDGGTLTGTIINRTAYHLDEAWVVAGDVAHRLGPLAPGQSAEVSLTPSSRRDPYSYTSVAQILLGRKLSEAEIRERHGIPPEQPLPPGLEVVYDPPTTPDDRRRVQLIDATVQPPGTGWGPSPMPLTFVALTSQPIGESVIHLPDHPHHHLGVLEQRLSLSPGPGSFRIPPALSQPEVSQISLGGLGGGGNGTLAWVELHGGLAAFDFRPPLPKGASVTALELTTQQLGPSVPWNSSTGVSGPLAETAQGAESGIFQLFNWQTGAFETLPAGQERVRLADPAAYLGPGGVVRVQVGKSDRVVRFLMPELTVEGRVAE